MESRSLGLSFRVRRCVCLVSLLSLTLSFLFVGRVHADEATMSAEPPELTVQAFEVFTVDINVSNVVQHGGLYAYEFRVRFRNDTLELISAIRPPGHFLEPVDPLNYFTVVWKLQTNEGNETFQVAHFGYTLLAPEKVRLGSGMLVRLEFVGFKMGSTEIDLFDTKMAPACACPIWHIAKDGYVTIVPCAPDPNQDGIVDILDLVMISLSFGSDFNSPNWNPSADINKDGVIDILDLASLSKNFG